MERKKNEELLIQLREARETISKYKSLQNAGTPSKLQHKSAFTENDNVYVFLENRKGERSPIATDRKLRSSTKFLKSTRNSKRSNTSRSRDQMNGYGNMSYLR